MVVPQSVVSDVLRVFLLQRSSQMKRQKKELKQHTRCQVCDVPLSDSGKDTVLACPRKKCPNQPEARNLRELAVKFPDMIGKLIDKDVL